MVKINQFVPFSPVSISVRPNICGTKYDGRVMLRVRSLNRSCPGCARPPVFSNFLIKCTQQSSCVAIGPVITTVPCPPPPPFWWTFRGKLFSSLPRLPVSAARGVPAGGLQALLATANRIVIFRIFPWILCYALGRWIMINDLNFDVSVFIALQTNLCKYFTHTGSFKNLC